MKTSEDRFYLDIDIRPFPYLRKDNGYYIFVDRIKDGTAISTERNVLECKSKGDIDNKIKGFISTYKKEYHYLRLWNSY